MPVISIKNDQLKNGGVKMSTEHFSSVINILKSMRARYMRAVNT